MPAYPKHQALLARTSVTYLTSAASLQMMPSTNRQSILCQIPHPRDLHLPNCLATLLARAASDCTEVDKPDVTASSPDPYTPSSYHHQTYPIGNGEPVYTRHTTAAGSTVIAIWWTNRTQALPTCEKNRPHGMETMKCQYDPPYGPGWLPEETITYELTC